MNDPFSLLQHVAKAGRLEHVNYITWNELPNDIVSITLIFQQMELTISAKDDDTVELSQDVKCEPDYSVRSNEERPWSDAVGKPIRWGWMMTNQQGYQDGLQLEFARSVSEPSTIVQIVAVASSLKVFNVRGIDESLTENEPKSAKVAV